MNTTRCWVARTTLKRAKTRAQSQKPVTVHGLAMGHARALVPTLAASAPYKIFRANDVFLWNESFRSQIRCSIRQASCLAILCFAHLDQ